MSLFSYTAEYTIKLVYGLNNPFSSVIFNILPNIHFRINNNIIL